MDARYTVHVPRNFNSELRTGGGTIIGSELTGTMSADTSGGKLKFTHLAWSDRRNDQRRKHRTERL